MRIATRYHTIEIDDETGSMTSLRATSRPDDELFAPAAAQQPLFTIDYLGGDREFRQVSSLEARSCELELDEDLDGLRLGIKYTGVGDLNLDARVTLRCPFDDPLTYWSLELKQCGSDIIANVQFPYVVLPYRYDSGGRSILLVPSGLGALLCDPRPEQLEPDYPDAWHFTSGEAHFTHYPGTTFAQFLAFYDSVHGVYVGCHDSGGRVKILKPVHREGAIRLGVAHVVGWDGSGDWSIGYEVAMGTFRGDWWDAAEIYRRWRDDAYPDEPRLHERQDVPAWLLDSPLHVILRIQGELDQGPAEPHPEFTPYENALPFLDELSARVDAPLVPVIMSWEQPGPWVYPNSFPVAGGDDSLIAFTRQARERGWHVGTYCNGTSWVTAHRWTGYDGREYYARHGAEESVCRLPDGTAWRNGWDAEWRHSYMCCVAVQQTRDIAIEYVHHLLGLGLDWIQFLDQNCGAASFPCYAEEHGHPSAPGAWMSGGMADLLTELESLATATGREISYSVEGAPNDHLLQRFSVCDIRPDSGSSFVPLYQYLFHDRILTQAAFAQAPNPYWMQIKTAHSFVFGDILTAIMGPGGRLINWDAHPWAPWSTPGGDQEAILTLLRRAIALRRGAGRDFLVLGRLLPGAPGALPLRGAEQVQWLCKGRVETFPSVLHACWAAPNGRMALALANWTRDEQAVRLEPALIGRIARRCLLQRSALEEEILEGTTSIELVLPPLSVALVEYGLVNE
ncbi:MAG: DUF6259 domain-containing protein [Chloroflexota bacterium]|nr:DUF6259 domain-containing protein [Chloroflexota bacterium]